MQKLKNGMKHIFKENGFMYNILSKAYHFVSTKKYNLTHRKKIKLQNKHFNKVIEDATEIIRSYNGEDYIVFYNPTWLGVAASTRGLFKNIVPLEQVFGKKNVQLISRCITENNIKSVIFSQIVDGWTQIIEEVKNIKPDIDIKVIWHGNCYEFFSDYTWSLNKEVMNLYNKKKINCFGFVRSTMYEFYKAVGFKSCYLQNNVNNVEKSKAYKKNDSDTVKIGIYNADSRELKNIYTALSAIKLVPNSTADVVPINEGASKFAEIIGLEISSLSQYISNDELMERIKKNDINIYPTFTENSPMFPLESFEMGVPCLLGNNNDYFVGTELGKYVILEREDDSVYIKEKIINAINNKEKIMNLYRNWKLDFNKRCEQYVNDFISM